MIQKFIYILIFFAYSCEEIQETTEDLPYDFLISEGWMHFENNAFDLSEDLFLDVLEFDEGMVPYYSAAYLGLGWTKLYQAKELSNDPVNNLDLMRNLRITANNYFNLIISECGINEGSDLCLNVDIPQELIFHTYAGLAYSNSLLAMYEDMDSRFECSSNNMIYDNISLCESDCKEYVCDLDQTVYSSISDCESSCMVDAENGNGSCVADFCFDSSISFTNIALQYSSFINTDPDYYFTYDPENINANSLHMLRAQLYVDLGQYDLAENELLLVDFVRTEITFTLHDSYNDIYNSYDRYLFVGFQGQNNSKHFIPMETEVVSYDCYYGCNLILDEENCLDGCLWSEIEGCHENSSDEYFDYSACDAACAQGECQPSFISNITVSFTPLLPCLYSYDVDVQIDLSDEEIIQCLESFPTNTLEYNFSIRFPASIVEGYQCNDIVGDDSLTIYLNEQQCIENCGSNECEIVDFDYANCSSQTELEFIEGIGCVETYMYSTEDLEGNDCSGGVRYVDIIQPGSPILSTSVFGSCGID